jgi:hypothetical protein
MNEKCKSPFLYQLEYYPNPECLGIQARVRFPDDEDHLMGGLDIRYIVKNHGEKVHPLYVGLAGIEGVISVHGAGRYTLTVEKANQMFTWEELIPKILDVIQTTVAGECKLKAIGRPIKPTSRELRELERQSREMSRMGMLDDIP